MQAIYSNNICIKCFDNVKNFCQFRKELLNNQAILYQVFSTEEDRMMRENREENFIDISQAVKIKLEVTENDSFNSNEMHFESEATMHDGGDQIPYHFKMEGNNADMGIYSECWCVVWGGFARESFSQVRGVLLPIWTTPPHLRLSSLKSLSSENRGIL